LIYNFQGGVRSAAICLAVLMLVNPAFAWLGSPRQSQDQKPKSQERGSRGNQHSFEELAAEANKHSFQDILNKDPDAVRNIEEIFAATSKIELKQRIASILIRIGVRDLAYFDFLAGEARRALAIDMPWAELFDEQTGKTTGINPAFVKWCEKHHRDQYEAFEEARYQVPVPWFYLASAGDPHAYDLLVQGLHAENKMIVMYAALGLAKLQDPRAIDALIAASRHEIAGARYEIAQALWHFPDDRAQATADALAKAFLQDAESRLGEKFPLVEIREAVKKEDPQNILAFEGLMPPSSILMPPTKGPQ
jgi:HEAT repeat protein